MNAIATRFKRALDAIGIEYELRRSALPDSAYFSMGPTNDGGMEVKVPALVGDDGGKGAMYIVNLVVNTGTDWPTFGFTNGEASGRRIAISRSR